MNQEFNNPETKQQTKKSAKKYIVALLGVVACLAVCISCSKKADENKPATGVAANVKGATGAIAYIDMDSLQANYEYFTEVQAQLESKQQSYQAQLQAQERNLLNLQNSIQNRMKNGQISSEEQYNQEMAKYQKQQQAYAQLQQTAAQEMQNLSAQFNEALQDSLDNFLAEFNKDKRFSLILNKAVTVYADPAMDITAEVTAGLNKRYKK